MRLHADIENLADITIYLHPLGRTAIFNLGLVLGLDHNQVKPLIDSPDFLADSGAETWVPTWSRLVEALRPTSRSEWDCQ